jgi:anti-sigma factor RsiW
MTRPFDDELLSAYLDDELSAEERGLVEDRLATSAADRELLDELRTLRSELRSLPTSGARNGFAERVVAAAVAAKGRETQVVVSPAAAPQRGQGRRWAYWVGAVALAVAACVVLVVGPWRGNPAIDGGSNVVVSPTLADQLIAQLRSAVPGEGEAVVVRLRVSSKAPLGQSLDMALAEAGILQRSAADTASGAVQVGAAYRQQILEKLGVTQPGPPSPELLDTTVEAAEAVFVEASLTQLEQVIASLSSEPSRALQLAAETKLVVALPEIEPGTAEGEAGSANDKAAGKGRNFSQRLNAGMFRLQKRELATPQPAAVNAAADVPKAPVRVLILVEQVD